MLQKLANLAKRLIHFSYFLWAMSAALLYLASIWLTSNKYVLVHSVSDVDSSIPVYPRHLTGCLKKKTPAWESFHKYQSYWKRQRPPGPGVRGDILPSSGLQIQVFCRMLPIFSPLLFETSRSASKWCPLLLRHKKDKTQITVDYFFLSLSED